MDEKTNTAELQHHGVKGQKWGVRRYQNKDGTRTAAGKKKRKFEDAVERAKNARVARSATSTDRREGQSDKEFIKAEKARILESGNAKEIFNNSKLFTDDELRSAVNRLDLERRIEGHIKKEPTIKDKIDHIIGWGNTVNNVLNTSTNLYNNTARIVNMFSSAKLPLVKDGNGNNNNKGNNDNVSDNQDASFKSPSKPKTSILGKIKSAVSKSSASKHAQSNSNKAQNAVSKVLDSDVSSSTMSSSKISDAEARGYNYLFEELED